MVLDFFKKSALLKAYDVGELLGSGNFAEVKRATRKSDGAQVAVKIIDKAKAGTLDTIEEEIDIMGRINHPHVVQLFEVIDESKKINLVMELVTGGELFDRIVERGSYTEADAAKCIREITEAISHLHANGICHRDLKPENILYASRDPEAPIKLADFGLAKVVSEKCIMQTACGTPGYVAPEILANQGFGVEVDNWSVGVVLYILLCGFPPFYEEELPRLFSTIMQGKYDFPSPWWDNISSDAKDLVSKLLVVDPKQRLSAAEVLQHPWITSTAPQDQLSATMQSLKKYNAHRKLKKVALGVMFQNRMASAINAPQR